jgi:hypothetical protein
LEEGLGLDVVECEPDHTIATRPEIESVAATADELSLCPNTIPKFYGLLGSVWVAGKFPLAECVPGLGSARVLANLDVDVGAGISAADGRAGQGVGNSAEVGLGGIQLPGLGIGSNVLLSRDRAPVDEVGDGNEQERLGRVTSGRFVSDGFSARCWL